MRDHKEVLMKMLLLDMKRWSPEALKEAQSYVDGMCLSQTGEDFLWWWELKKAIRKELDIKEATQI